MGGANNVLGVAFDLVIEVFPRLIADDQIAKLRENGSIGRATRQLKLIDAFDHKTAPG